MKIPKNLEPIVSGLSAAVVIGVLAFLTLRTVVNVGRKISAETRGLDPNKINKGGRELEAEVKRLLLITKGRNHIYCSGHGLLPNTPINNVERIIEIIKNWYVSYY